jgi:hypothetical protein
MGVGKRAIERNNLITSGIKIPVVYDTVFLACGPAIAF